MHNSKNHFSSFCIHIPADNIYKYCFAGISMELVILNENVQLGILNPLPVNSYDYVFLLFVLK